MRKLLLTIAIVIMATSQIFAVSTLELESKMNPVREEVTQDIEQAKAGLIDRAYPVGSYYTTTEDIDAADMHDMLGGTWKRVKNTFLWADNVDIGATKGKAEYNLSATLGADGDDELAMWLGNSSGFTPSFTIKGDGFGTGSFSGSIPITEMGSSSRSIRFMPPYLAVRMFRRVS